MPQPEQPPVPLNIHTQRLTFNHGTSGRRVYLAGPATNAYFATVKFALEHAWFDVYDHRETPFDWEHYELETPKQFNQAMQQEKRILDARDTNASALQYCDFAVLVLPAGKTSHGESMIALGMGKRVYAIAMNGYIDPTLLYGYLKHPVFTDLSTLVEKMKWDKDCQ